MALQGAGEAGQGLILHRHEDFGFSPKWDGKLLRFKVWERWESDLCFEAMILVWLEQMPLAKSKLAPVLHLPAYTACPGSPMLFTRVPF